MSRGLISLRHLALPVFSERAEKGARNIRVRRTGVAIGRKESKRSSCLRADEPSPIVEERLDPWYGRPILRACELSQGRRTHERYLVRKRRLRGLSRAYRRISIQEGHCRGAHNIRFVGVVDQSDQVLLDLRIDGATSRDNLSRRRRAIWAMP